MPGPILEVSGISRSFGGVFALKDVSLTVPQGQLRAIIGPNGAGKSTLFNIVSGHLQPTSGTVKYCGQVINRAAPHQRAREGMAIVFQGARIFSGMTALENVMVGAHCWTRSNFLTAALRLPRHAIEERLIRQRALQALEQVGLADWAGRTVEVLPIGQQRRLQVARALCSQPRLLLLDEPASGLRLVERNDLAVLVGELRQGGLTILLIEHDVPFVMRLADEITVLDLGSVIADGTAQDVVRNPRVVTAYLGAQEDVAHVHAE